jgi:hypothetical protein
LLCDLDTPKAIHGSFLGHLGIIPRARLHFGDRRQLRSRFSDMNSLMVLDTSTR